MATLERERDASPSLAGLVLDDISELSTTPVPKPFPADAQSLARTASRSPSATRGLNGLMDKVKRAMSRERGDGVERSRTREARDTDTIEEEDTPRGRTNPLQTIGSKLSATTSRSTSRGRPTLSTGRGGAGNMIPTDSVSTRDEDDAVLVAARERAKSRSQSRGREEVVVGGRGGRGNIRSASRSGGEKTEEQKKAASAERERERKVELEVEEKRAKEAPTKVWSTGRGGAGNRTRG
ncbi:hypothetical protein RQP46_007216 [Phenoliferia psychrophenolica]